MYKNIFLVLSSIIFTGCVSYSGPKFSGQVKPSKGKALVHIYRPVRFSGAAVVQNIFIDEKQPVELYNGSYFSVELDPGVHEFKSAIRDTWGMNEIAKIPLSVNMKLLANETYYLVRYISAFAWSKQPEEVFIVHSQKRDNTAGPTIVFKDYFGFIHEKYAQQEIAKCGKIDLDAENEVKVNN